MHFQQNLNLFYTSVKVIFGILWEMEKEKLKNGQIEN